MSEVPGWLAGLAAAAATIRVPAVLRPPAAGGRRSAVLVLFGEGPAGPDLLYIQRSAGLRRHAGQPAFPGGALEPAELADPGGGTVAAALREAQEEVGVDPAGVDVLATMPEMFISRSGFRVAPVLAWWREPSAVRPVDVGEVAAVERIPVVDLADPRHRLMLRVPSGHLSPAFRVGSMLIWGFTAALTDRLLSLAGWERPWDSTHVRELPEGA
ncbi:MAG TPA: CoA pyrophosphatase [Trebonia sp.]|jgi:8-oxo-dGTP pyrophosphatase MutT (NUDIX family)|nr:CoA pyrophosphatase [Trebonia sp.]